MSERKIISHTTDGKPIYALPVRSQADMGRAVQQYRAETGKTGALSHAEVNRAIAKYSKD